MTDAGKGGKQQQPTAKQPGTTCPKPTSEAPGSPRKPPLACHRYQCSSHVLQAPRRPFSDTSHQWHQQHACCVLRTCVSRASSHRIRLRFSNPQTNSVTPAHLPSSTHQLCRTWCTAPTRHRAGRCWHPLLAGTCQALACPAGTTGTPDPPPPLSPSCFHHQAQGGMGGHAQLAPEGMPPGRAPQNGKAVIATVRSKGGRW